jgi:hypothetical protein
VGIREYLILDPPTRATNDRLLLTGYRLGPDGRYRRIEPDREGWLLSETTHLLFAVAADGRTPRVVDAVTGKPLLTSSEVEEALKAAEEQSARESAARQAAEAQAAREAAARQAAEDELAQLRAELERRGRS